LSHLAPCKMTIIDYLLYDMAASESPATLCVDRAAIAVEILALLFKAHQAFGLPFSKHLKFFYIFF
jgi:hypothetical protein